MIDKAFGEGATYADAAAQAAAASVARDRLIALVEQVPSTYLPLTTWLLEAAERARQIDQENAAPAEWAPFRRWLILFTALFDRLPEAGRTTPQQDGRLFGALSQAVLDAFEVEVRETSPAGGIGASGVNDRDRVLWTAIRRALLAVVAAIDCYLSTDQKPATPGTR